MDTKETIKEIMAETFAAPKEDITEDSNVNNTQGWDSLANVRLVLKLEHAFNIMIDPSELLKMRDFKGVYETVSKHIAKN